jgi:hypothetical protein
MSRVLCILGDEGPRPARSAPAVRRRKLTQLGEARTGLTFEQLPGRVRQRIADAGGLRSAPGGIERR